MWHTITNLLKVCWSYYSVCVSGLQVRIAWTWYKIKISWNILEQNSIGKNLCWISSCWTWGSHNQETRIWLFLNNILYKVMDLCYFPTELGHWGYLRKGSSFFYFCWVFVLTKSLWFPTRWHLQISCHWHIPLQAVVWRHRYCKTRNKRRFMSSQ